MINNKTIRQVVINSKLFPCSGTSYHEVTGSICNFETDLAAPLKSCEVTVTPSQSGTGDPSPTNPRPLNPFSGLTVEHTGANIFGGSVLKDGIVASMPSATVDTVNKTVTFASNATVNQRITDGYISGKFKENTQYTFILALEKTSGVGSNLSIYYTDGTYTAIPNISTTDTKEIKTVVSTSGKTVNFLSKANQAGSTIVYYDECGIFEGLLTESDFEAYTGTTYPVSWTSKGTIYGGYYNSKTGELWKTWLCPAINWQQYNQNNGYKAYRGNDRFPRAKHSQAGMSNMISEFGSFSSASMNKNIIQLPTSEGVDLYCALDENVDISTLVFIYELATPVLVGIIDPTKIKTFKGVNNIWNDAGETTVKYPLIGGSCNGIMKFLPIFYPNGKN